MCEAMSPDGMASLLCTCVRLSLLSLPSLLLQRRPATSHPRGFARVGVIELRLFCRAAMKIKPPSSDEEEPAGELDSPEALEERAQWCVTRMNKWAKHAVELEEGKRGIAAGAALLRAGSFKDRASSLRAKERLARIGSSSKLCPQPLALVVKQALP